MLWRTVLNGAWPAYHKVKPGIDGVIIAGQCHWICSPLSRASAISDIADGFRGINSERTVCWPGLEVHFRISFLAAASELYMAFINTYDTVWGKLPMLVWLVLSPCGSNIPGRSPEDVV